MMISTVGPKAFVRRPETGFPSYAPSAMTRSTGLSSSRIRSASRDLLARLRYKDLIASGPRAPRPGAPHTFVTTPEFLATFDLQTLRDLPELDLAVGNAD